MSTTCRWRRSAGTRRGWSSRAARSWSLPTCRRSFQRLADVSASWLPIPWSFDYLPEARSLMGEDPWPYGVAPNRATLSAFLGFAFEQGVCARGLEPEDLFPPSVQRTYRL